jgi:hypothetical protein
MPNHPGTGFGTRGHPPSLSAGGDAIDDAWYEEYFVDFTTRGDASITHNTQVALGTQTGTSTTANWLPEEDNLGDDNNEIGTLEWEEGEGLKITPVGSGSHSNVHASIDAPCLSVALTDCIPNLTQNDVICVQAFCTEPVPINANFDGYGIVIYKPETNLGSVEEFVVFRNYYKDGDREWATLGKAGSNTPQAESGVGTVPRMIEMVFQFNGGHAVCATSISTSITQTPLAATSNRGHVHSETLIVAGGSFSPTWYLTAAAARLGIYAYKVSSATSFFMNFSAVRILRLGGRAGGAD